MLSSPSMAPRPLRLYKGAGLVGRQAGSEETLRVALASQARGSPPRRVCAQYMPLPVELGTVRVVPGSS